MKKYMLFILLLTTILITTAVSFDLKETVYSPSELGINETKFAKAVTDFLRYSSDVHDVLVIKDDKIIFNATKYPYIEDTPHGMMSCTKSVASLLTGIAIDEGYIDSIHEPLYRWFPELKNDADKSKLTLYHLLSMTTGLDWNEDGAYDETDSYMVMQASPNPVNYFFSRRSTFTPGSHFEYNSGATAILGIILEKAVGMDLLTYAESRLFAPLGIQKVFWLKMSTGTRNAASSLYLTPRGMGLIGLLTVNNGTVNDQQIVSSDWIRQSTEKILETRNGLAGSYGYGLSWWMNSREGYSARGYGGQFILCYPKHNLVIVTTGGLFGNDFYNPDTVLGNGILDSLNDPIEDQNAMERCYALFSEKDTKTFRVNPSNMIFLDKTYQFEDGSRFKLSESDSDDVFNLKMAINDNTFSVKIPKDGTYVPADLGNFGGYEKNLAMLAIGNLSNNRFELVIRRLHSMYIYKYDLRFFAERATWTSYVSCFRNSFEQFSGKIIDE
jgi:CubicO group peptidase (beta-lactamase class C family)